MPGASRESKRRLRTNNQRPTGPHFIYLYFVYVYDFRFSFHVPLFLFSICDRQTRLTISQAEVVARKRERHRQTFKCAHCVVVFHGFVSQIEIMPQKHIRVREHWELWFGKQYDLRGKTLQSLWYCLKLNAGNLGLYFHSYTTYSDTHLQRHAHTGSVMATRRHQAKLFIFASTWNDIAATNNDILHAMPSDFGQTLSPIPLFQFEVCSR